MDEKGASERYGIFHPLMVGWNMRCCIGNEEDRGG